LKNEEVMSNESNAQENAAPQAAPEANPLEAELAKARDDMLRALAEVENTRRRAEKQAQDARIYAIDRFARDLLPVADTLARALQAISPEARAAADEATRTLLDGIELTERSLIDTFARHGLKRVGAKGDAFDPNLHQAVAQAPSDHPANTIIEVLQPGYVLGDRTVRAAMVMVSAGKAATAPEAGASVDIKV
jgi:molecular chaperone GrpE